MKQTDTPIVDALQRHIKQLPLSFHVPGHKNGLVPREKLPAGFQSFLRYDMTEITGMDDLHSPEGCIWEAQQLLTDLYRTRKSYFLVNGSTVGNLAMIMSVCKEGDTVFVQRNAHKSIFHALKLARLNPVFLDTEYDRDLQAAGHIGLDTLTAAYDRFPSAKAVVFTYPTYYGMAGMKEDIIKLAKQHGSFVLVDEAHGPHFILPEPFPASSLELGADIVVHSAHKMLPAMTMGSYLHVQSADVPLEKLEFYLQALQSSSPSYPIMASLDAARAYLAGMTKEDQSFALQRRDRLALLLHRKGIEVIFPDDPLKMMLRKPGYSGYELQKTLEQVHIYTEMADAAQVLCTLPLVKQGDDAFFNEAAQKLSKLKLEERPACLFPAPILSQQKVSALALSYKEQETAPIEWKDIQEATGRIAAETIIPYPPGIPCIMSGEKIAEEQALAVEEWLQQGVHIQGGQKLKEKKLAVFIDNQINN
ncbi:aminotransferase class I/II-fold pyridoxal phosphate-dependent enzyme [Bacillus badius]|uniref:aminotransferase class I/II-fold pyridoxal phosphate-dependent enzyme n=1 Tax=Bacillus badius TaxID=1455 RepID=UPI002E1A18FE|nr:aminotransferase class I/II-fold pyridoxal phosphate-dependent enzyme [Bacillus badius]MED0667665.1 aminotransferase class I/II-fold pyridoxal phosphate-dependent enzyme [Bacillus badius]